MRMKAETLSLYQFRSCPYCHMVGMTLDRLGVELERRDVLAEPRFADELLRATGRHTVPCLRIEEDGGVQWLHETSDIIDYLEQRFSR